MTATTGNDYGPRRSFLVGLVGQGVKPSLTPEMHEREAWRQRIRYVYKTIDLGDDEVSQDYLRRLLEFAVRLGFDGLNVTHPIKQAIVPLVDELSADVATIGALNTVLIRDGRTVGHNTDVTGFEAAFREGLPDASLNEVLLLGAGGAGTAVAHALDRLGVRRLLVVDPETSQARRLVSSVQRLPSEMDVVSVPVSELVGAMTAVTGLVNATPVGMHRHPGLPLPVELLHPQLWVADIVYRPLVTDLLTAASEQGCRTLSGAGMAVHQAADSFERITGLPADRAAMSGDFDDLVDAEVEGMWQDQSTHHVRELFGEGNR